MKKRILSIVLTLCMVLMLVPITANATQIFVDLRVTGAATLTLEVESGDMVVNVQGSVTKDVIADIELALERQRKQLEQEKAQKTKKAKGTEKEITNLLTFKKRQAYA